MNQYPVKVGTWKLTDPDGRFWIGPSPLRVVKAEIDSRVPASVQLQRVFDGLAEPDPLVDAAKGAVAAFALREDLTQSERDALESLSKALP